MAMSRTDTSGDLATAPLDAMPDATVLLDPTGVIVAVNRAWRMFTVDNGGDPTATGVGVNYLEVCRRAAVHGCPEAMLFVAGLENVMNGATVEADIEYPCPSPAVGRWFVARVTLVEGPQVGFLVSHVNISARKTAERDLEVKASRDPLTGLANRALFNERLAVALTAQPSRSRPADVGVIYIDLDGFKPVNDTYGHAAGDEVLQATGSRLRSLARDHDTVARLGGDEFALVAPRMSSVGLMTLAVRIDTALGVPHRIFGEMLVVHGSVGTHLAVAGEDPAQALHEADEAMYAVKRARKAARR